METRGRVFLVLGLAACLLTGVGVEHFRQVLTAPIPETALLPEQMAAAVPTVVQHVKDEAAERALRSDLETVRKRVAELEKNWRRATPKSPR